jgi:uncharacterized membrane protein YcaP (DUF421 family)
MQKLIHVDWADLFVPHHSVAEMIIRGTLMYAALFIILRFLMKRQAGTIGIADILVIVVIADAAQNAFAKEYRSLTEGIVLVLTIVFWDFAMDWAAYRLPRVQRVLQPPPLPLVVDGKMVRRNMRREYITMEELKSQLRLQGVDDLTEVRAAYMEGDGQISVIRRRT